MVWGGVQAISPQINNIKGIMAKQDVNDIEAVNLGSQLREQAITEVVNEKPAGYYSVEGLVEAVSKRFIEKRIDDFPRMCYETRKTNALIKKAHDDLGNNGGWSASKDFKFDYQIPRDLYLFMQNLVYREFWSEDNEKVWRSFMKAICRGDESTNLLMKVKAYYGSNKEGILV